MTKREITKLEKQIVNDIMSRSNYGVEKTTEIVRPMIDFGYTIHEQDYYKLKKAIDVLKDKFEIVNVREFLLNEYILETPSHLFNLTKEEYELLKEVLENE